MAQADREHKLSLNRWTLLRWYRLKIQHLTKFSIGCCHCIANAMERVRQYVKKKENYKIVELILLSIIFREKKNKKKPKSIKLKKFL